MTGLLRWAIAAACCLLPLSPHAAESTANATHLDLWQLYQQARDADPRILKAAAETRSGAGFKREAYGQLLPQVYASSGLNRSQREDDLQQTQYNGQSYALGINQVLYAPQVWQNYKKFSALAEQFVADQQSTEIEAAIDLIERYFGVLAAEDQLALIVAEQQATQGNLKRVEALFKRKMARITDVLEISARLDSLQAARIEAQNQVELSREAIAELVGRPITRPLKRIGSHFRFSLPEHTQTYWLNSAEQFNPALKARSLGISAAQAAVKEAKAQHLPSIGLNLSAQRSDIGYEGALAPRSDLYVASLGIQLPLYSGGSTNARISALHGKSEAAEQDYEILRRQIIRETRTAYLNVESAVARIKATNKALQSAQKSRVAAERAFAYGVLNAADVLDSVQQEFSAKRDMLKSQYSYLTGVLVLRRWGGRLTENDVREVNGWLTD